MNTSNKTEKIIYQFIKQFKERHKKDNSLLVEGILLAGSYAFLTKISKNADLDLFLVINNIGKRYRGMARVGDMEVDFFINPIEQLRADFAKAKDTSNKTMVYALADGKILKDRNKNLEKLKKEAKIFLKDLSRVEVAPPTVTLMRYFIDDYLKDVEDSYLEKDYLAWQYNINLLLNYLIEVFCKNNQILLVKPKYQKGKILEKNPHFVKLYEDVAKASDREDKMAAIKKLSAYVLDNLGGRLPKEWEMESPLKL